MALVLALHHKHHGRSWGQGQIFTEANMLTTSPVGNVAKCSLWKHNILPLFDLGWWYFLLVATECSCSAGLFKTGSQ